MAAPPRIMVIDDELDIVQVARKALEKWGFEVDTFSNSLQAYKTFKKNPNKYSLVLVDFRMPEVNGVALAVLLRQVRNDIKILVMTAYDITLNDIDAVAPEAKPLELLNKPFGYNTICEAVKRHLSQS